MLVFMFFMPVPNIVSFSLVLVSVPVVTGVLGANERPGVSVCGASARYCQCQFSFSVIASSSWSVRG